VTKLLIAQALKLLAAGVGFMRGAYGLLAGLQAAREAAISSAGIGADGAQSEDVA
jgi:hypothetical protein